MKRNRFLLVLLGVGLLLVLAACAPGTDRYAETEPAANFFHGIWHGWIAPISLIWQIFDPDIRVYEDYNNGFWYDLGFYLAVVGGFGGLAFSRNRSKKSDD